MIKHIFTLIWNRKKSNFLLFLEIFLAFLILFAVFAFVSHNLRIYQQPLGYNTENTWIVGLHFDEGTDSAFIADTKIRLREELKTFPEIAATAYSGYVVPLGTNNWSTSHDNNGFDIKTQLFFGDEHYDKAANLNLLEGRWFNETDKNAKQTPVVVSKRFKELFFKDKPILDSVYNIYGENKIVGIVDHYRYRGEFSEERPMTMVYKEGTLRGSPNLSIRLKAEGSPALEERVNKTIAAITKKQDFAIEHLAAKRKKDSLETWVPIVLLLSISGFLILNIALGLFGVVWYNISKRRPEVGLRRAVGATSGAISLQFIGEVMAIVIIGILVGLFFAVQLPLLKLVDIENSNYYYAMLAATVLIVLVVLVCTFYPSRQAAAIQPALALHEE